MTQGPVASALVHLHGRTGEVNELTGAGAITHVPPPTWHDLPLEAHQALPLEEQAEELEDELELDELELDELELEAAGAPKRRRPLPRVRNSAFFSVFKERRMGGPLELEVELELELVQSQ